MNKVRKDKFKREKDDVKSTVQSWLRLASQRRGGVNFRKYRYVLLV